MHRRKFTTLHFAVTAVGVLLMAGLAIFPGAKVAASTAGAAAGWLPIIPVAKVAWGGLLLLWMMMFFSFELSHLFTWGLRRYAHQQA
jgi:hypothetical protein